MLIQVLRYSTTPDDTLGMMLINGVLACYTIEDTQRAVKVDGQTRIPSGTYRLTLRNVGGMTGRYSERFDFHRGMLHLQDVPEFQWVYIHVGNDEDDTLGCILVGDNPPNIGADQRVGSSAVAYSRIYPLIYDAIMRGEQVNVQVMDIG